jgi:hypothetical protein
LRYTVSRVVEQIELVDVVRPLAVAMNSTAAGAESSKLAMSRACSGRAPARAP